ncbi:MAG: hypothetical protein J0M12_07185 [Deltaproteobacteria bacterium]|nr:hypothetical protein [Deltaproteobacteria bacterium]
MLLLSSLSGCFLAPAIDSFNKLGVTESDRQALLEDRFRKFSDALYWGAPGEAITFVTPESRGDLEPEFRRIRKQEKIVDSRIESVGFSDNSFTATIEVLQKYYRVPYYVVNERTESQEWKFHINGGWLLVSTKEVKDG